MITKLGFGIATAHCASIHLRNKNNGIVKPTSKFNIFCEIQAEPKADSNLMMRIWIILNFIQILI
ncbi:hypothetical protein V2I22_03010 [Campylobacter sp. CLAX-7218-21]|uniref:hypothetical protein n=1 Tax=Campylobacter devanensis TaxID=3161138 RepID=UPI002EB0A24E|nr:hypothetical protein [Campylobacter sp. CLAX-7218-21]